jgi:anti-sigma regulatory factor (Ser/Thr protein kinase)
MSSVPGHSSPSSIPAIPVSFGPVRGRATPPAPYVVHQNFAATPTAARWARRHAAAVLAAWGASALESTVLQIVSELVANAAARPVGRGAPFSVGLTLRLLPDRISIEVFDPDPTTPPAIAPACHDAERGRGMAIVRALACRTGVMTVAQGKIVYAQVHRLGQRGGG